MKSKKTFDIQSRTVHNKNIFLMKYERWRGVQKLFGGAAKRLFPKREKNACCKAIALPTWLGGCHKNKKKRRIFSK